jgi:hypothetical protein
MTVTKTILKRTNLRVYPTKAQEVVLSQSFGNSRFIWNYYVSIFLNKDLTTKIYPTVKELKEINGFDFLKLKYSFERVFEKTPFFLCAPGRAPF